MEDKLKVMIEESTTLASKFLDRPFTTEETDATIKSLKADKTGVHDGVVSEKF